MFQRIDTFYSAYLKTPLQRIGLHPVVSEAYFRILRRQSRDLRTFHAADTELRFFCEGIGERMIVQQAGPAFERVAEVVRPDVDELVISAGASKMALNPIEGELNAYWWWSMGGRPDFLDFYMDNVSVKPDIILCPSQQTAEAAEEAGFETIYLPLAVGPQFHPMERERTGLGYAGAKNYEETGQQESILGPLKNRDDFEWVNDKATPDELSEWYNRRLITFGMTRQHQERMGMVNNRVFETLGTGTPFILYDHRSVEDVLGFKYPYQSDSAERTRVLVEDITADPDEHLATFMEYAERVHNEHSYEQRFEKLLSVL